jgi:hypothetical protein
MAIAGLLLAATLFAADSTTSPATDDSAAPDPNDVTSGAGVAPVELIPRLELRQSFVQLHSGVSAHVTTTEVDISYTNRVLLRYQGPLKVVNGPNGQTNGFGDVAIQAVVLFASSPRFLVATITGVVLDTASQPVLGDGKQQLVLGGAVGAKPVRWWLPYLIVQEQISVAGDAARPDVNQLLARVGNIIFGKGFNWLKVDLDTLVDFAGDAGSLLGTLEVGSLLVGRTGMFMRSSTQLLGTRQLDYSVEVGVRYLFRLAETKKPAGTP